MTSKELKELVKQHFSLTEVSFGEVKDINNAFTLIFEGDVLEVGKDVKVRTEEGQELSAPDGYHELENGMMIKTEGGKVTEITTASAEETEAEMAEEISEVEGVIEEKMAEEVVEEETETMEEEAVAPMVEEVAKAVIEAVKEEIAMMKEEMEALKKKMAEMEDAPATDKAEPEVMSKSAKTTNEPFNKARFAMVMERASKK